MLKNKIPKTLILIPDLNGQGGVANYYRTLNLEAENNITYFTVNSAKHYSTVRTAIILFYKYCSFFLKLISNNYDLILSNPSLEGKGKSFYREMIFILITHLLNRKSIIFFRGWAEHFEEKIRDSKFTSFLFKISYAKASRFIVLGDIFKQKLVSLGVPEGTKFYIETTVADTTNLKDFKLENKFLTYEKEINFLFLSRIEKIKGIYIVVDAYNKFVNKFPDRNSKLVFAGDGPDLSALKVYVKEQSIQNIQFLGYVSGQNKRNVLLESHVMVLPSFTEGLPNTILEGMLYGMPIISRSVGGIPELVHQNVNGFTSKSFDPLIFTAFFYQIASQYTLYREIATTNHQIALNKFTSEKVKERILRILESCETKK